MNVFPSKIEQWFSITDIDFHWFSIFDKILRRLSIAESGSFGFLIVEVSFHGLFINHIKFHGLSFNETNFLAMHSFDNGPTGVLVFLLRHWRRQFPRILLRWNTISRIFHQWISIRLISNGFNSFPWISFQLEGYPRNFNQGNRFPRKPYTRSFNFFHNYPTNRFCSQGRSIGGKGFFGFHRF